MQSAEDGDGDNAADPLDRCLRRNSNPGVLVETAENRS
jgi:hypothetical protein